ncbi:MAG: amino acid adenylation domain-containing protein [Planctomycetota bacterium]
MAESINMQTEQIYRNLNVTAVDFPHEHLHALISAKAVESPDAVAVVCDDQQQSYHELNRLSDQVAAWLQSKNIGSGDLVGLCCDRNLETPALLVGIMKSGAGYVPLDPEYPVDRLNYMVADSGLKHVIGHANQRHLIEDFGIEYTIFDEQYSDIDAAGSYASSGGDPHSDVAYVIYTSGSTGKPKGVVVPHSCAVNFLYSMLKWPGFRTDDRILATTTLSFDISVLEMFLPLVAGGSVAVVDRKTAKDADKLVDAIIRNQVTLMQATPAMWRMILESDFEGGPEMKFFTGGEPLPRDLIDPLLKRCGELWNLYGPTETAVYSTGAQITSSEDRILIGKPYANTTIYVVDEDNRLCDPETPGELLIGGAGVTAGYLNRDKLTAEKFFMWNGERVYRTGDLARITEDGQVDHMGRIDSQIKLHGHRIELGEIDAAMARQPGVRLAATALREDTPGDQRLIGYLLAEEGASLDTSNVREAISSSLPEYMIPSLIVIVDEFHYTPSGKLDRKAFPAPSTQRPETDTPFVAPRSADERRMADIWADVLQLDRVGIKDNFFEIGGNSIRAMKVVTRVRTESGLPLSAAEFFDNPTIDAFLSLAEQKRSSGANHRTRKHKRTGSGRYAIVGMAARMPGADNLAGFWNNLVNNCETIRSFEKDELDPTLDPRDTSADNYVAARGIIEQADHFDARFFTTPPRAAEMMDPQQRVMLELAWNALEDAGCIPGKTDDTIGIWAGTYTTSYFFKNVLTNPELVRETGEFNAGVYNEKDYIATRVAHKLNLTGPAVSLSTACSTSLVALIEACKSLDSGTCDVALAGGVSVTFPQNSGHLHQTGSIFTPDGHCRPFDEKGAGTLFSDGAGLVVVKRLEDAIKNSDRIYAVVRGFGINNDGGEKASFSAPSIKGQAAAISMAQETAGVHADDIGYIEAHGTATPIGDPIEVSALCSIFTEQSDNLQYCAIGSVKSNIGHTVAAAGVAGLMKAALALHHEVIPATLHFKSPNPQIDFENSPFYVCDRNQPWQRSDRPRIAGISSFGVGGTNAHVIIEEAPEPAVETGEEITTLPVELLPVSAKTEEALNISAGQITEFLQTNDVPLENAAATLQRGREDFAWRAIVVAGDKEDAIAHLSSRKQPRFLKRKSSPSKRDVVFMFPGQGSQYVRMGQNLYEHSEVFRNSMDACCDILTPLLEKDLRDVLFPPDGDEETAAEILRETRYTQPALFALGYSLAQVWLQWGIHPSALMGHSIGEFAAACIAGVFKLEDGLEMIARRGAMMQKLPGGSMMSVRIPGNEVEPLLWGEMAIGSFNGPSLCVVAGPVDQVAELQKQLESRDVVCRHLHTSHAFHSPMMQEIVKPYEEFIAGFKLSAPAIPVLSTVTGKWMTDEQATDPAYWAAHLREPVRFSDAVNEMWNEDPTRILIELGPRKTLATLSRQHATDPKNQDAFATLSDNAENNAEWTAMLTALGQLWMAGADVDWTRVFHTGCHTSLPTYPFQRKRFFIEPNQPQHQTPGSPASSLAPATAPEESCIATASPVAAAEPPTNTDLFNTNTGNAGGRTSMSRRPNLVSIIKEVFENTSGFDLDEFDGDTTFFEMGLDSLVLTQTATALKKEFAMDVTFRQLLEETPNVDTLADFLDSNLPAGKFMPEEVATDPDTATAQPAAPAPVAQSPHASVAAEPAQVQNFAPSTNNASPVPAIATAPAQTQLAPVQVSPIQQMSLPPATGNGAQAIIQGQLQLMAAQLQVLSGTPVQNNVAVQQPAAVPAPNQTPTQTALQQPQLEQATPASQQEAPQQQSTAAAPEQTPSLEAAPANDDQPKKKTFGAGARVALNDGTLNDEQQSALDEIIRMHNEMTPKSKAYAQQHRAYMADPRTVSGFRPNMKEMTHPIVVDKSKGVYLWDIDGNEYIDYTCGFGSNFLGHGHDITIEAISEQVQLDYAIGPQSPLAGEVANLFCEVTGNERMAFANTGSEAVLGCTRLARAATGRNLVVMFNGDYHGILDEVIVRGSKKRKSFPAATGIPKEHVGNTLILDYGTDESLQIIKDNMDDIAAVLVEPVQSRKPELQPRAFLQELRRMTENEPTALIFDEVISGLRIAAGGAQEYFGVKADLASYGKVVGGGMPIGVIAGKAQYMDGLDGGFWQFGDESRPEAGMTYFAGTFVRHPLTLAASKAILEHIRQGGRTMYDRINGLSDYLGEELNKLFIELDAPLYLAHFGSLFKVQFHEELVYGELLFAALRRRGMHIWDHRPCLLTLAHTKDHIDQFVAAFHDSIVECQRYGFLPGEGYKKAKQTFDANRPPVKGARAGKDSNGNPGWFIADSQNPGQFIQVGMPTS